MRQMQSMQNAPASVSDRLKSTFLDFVKLSASTTKPVAEPDNSNTDSSSPEISVTHQKVQRITHIRVVRGQQEDLVKFKSSN